MANINVDLTLDQAVQEVLALLTGLDLTYSPEFDRYRVVARQLNRALRNNALEHEWSYYSSTEEVGTVHVGDQTIELRASVRPRIIGDDAVRFVNAADRPVLWAYLLPRDTLSKYAHRPGLWASVTKSTLEFSRPLGDGLEGLRIFVPVMREPVMFAIPDAPEDPDEDVVPMPEDTREQTVDFDFPDVIVMRAAYQIAQTDPVMQPRVQSLEAQYKDLMYQLIERDDRHTDAPLQNEFFVPGVHGDIYGAGTILHGHPHADPRR
jgi:hypothetical protein